MGLIIGARMTVKVDKIQVWHFFRYSLKWKPYLIVMGVAIYSGFGIQLTMGFITMFAWMALGYMYVHANWSRYFKGTPLFWVRGRIVEPQTEHSKEDIIEWCGTACRWGWQLSKDKSMFLFRSRKDALHFKMVWG